MNKHLLFKKASLIHAEKCNKSNNWDEAVESFDQLQQFKQAIAEMNEDDYQRLNKQLEEWAIA